MPVTDPFTEFDRDQQDLLRTADVAVLFRVSTRTVSEWARLGRLPCLRTPGGQWRYPAGPIMRLANQVEVIEVAPSPWDQSEPATTAPVR
jgi:excisionase family DNA binding protein